MLINDASAALFYWLKVAQGALSAEMKAVASLGGRQKAWFLPARPAVEGARFRAQCDGGFGLDGGWKFDFARQAKL